MDPARDHRFPRRPTPRSTRPLDARARAWGARALLLAAAFLGALAGCNGGGGGAPARDPALDRKLERLLALILDVEQRGAGDGDSASAEATRLIAELGGPDSTARILSDRLLRNAEHWIPILDSLSRVPIPAPRAPEAGT